MAGRKLKPLFALLKKIFFLIAFAGYILLQLAALVLLLWAVSEIVSDDNYFVVGILIALAFFGPFLIGAGSYLVFRRITREDCLRAESEKWLAERRHPNPLHLKRRKTFKRWALWIPTVIVALVCVFFDQALPFASHLLLPQSGRLVGYQVSIPLTWTVTFSKHISDGDAYSVVVAQRYRGLLVTGSGLYVGRRPPSSISTMDFRSTPGRDPFASKPDTPIISTRTVPFGKRAITCWEEPPPQWMIVKRYIRCSTPEGDFSGGFSDSDEDASDFYRTLESVKITK